MTRSQNVDNFHVSKRSSVRPQPIQDRSCWTFTFLILISDLIKNLRPSKACRRYQTSSAVHPTSWKTAARQSTASPVRRPPNRLLFLAMLRRQVVCSSCAKSKGRRSGSRGTDGTGCRRGRTGGAGGMRGAEGTVQQDNPHPIPHSHDPLVPHNPGCSQCCPKIAPGGGGGGRAPLTDTRPSPGSTHILRAVPVPKMSKVPMTTKNKGLDSRAPFPGPIFGCPGSTHQAVEFGVGVFGPAAGLDDKPRHKLCQGLGTLANS